MWSWFKKACKGFEKEQRDSLYMGFNRKCFDLKESSNLLEITLQDLDSVPVVYYKGERIFEDRLVSILYNFEAETENADADFFGKQTIEIKGFDIEGYHENKMPSLDTIGHKRGLRLSC